MSVKYHHMIGFRAHFQHKVQVKTTVGRARHFSEVLKKEEIRQVKIVEVQNGSFYRQKFKSALSVLHPSIKNSKRWDFRDRRGELRNRRSHSEIEEAPAFSKVGLAHKPPIPDTEECQLSQPRQHPSHATQLCENYGQSVEAPIPTICLSQPRQHLSHAISALNEAQNSKRKFRILKRPLLYRDVSTSVNLHICVA
ncbi:hypothetical protein PS1_038221 [Malus domestica]